MITVLLIATLFTCSGCATWSRWGKDINSDISGGLNRKINVYTVTGKKIAEYEGKIDLEVRNDGVVKFDMNGKRYMYYNALVEVVEK